MRLQSEHYCELAVELQHFERVQPFKKNERIENLRPIRATLSGIDFWKLQDQRRRREIGGSAEDPLLAAYLRAKLADARIVTEPEAMHSFATAGSVVACRVDNQLPRGLRLYHWTPPVQRCAVSTGTWLGAVLIGMAPNQIDEFPGPETGFRRVEALYVNAEELLPPDGEHFLSRRFPRIDHRHI